MIKVATTQMLEQFISIPSISADPTRVASMDEAVTFLSKTLEALGFVVSHSQKGSSPPLIIARKDVGAKCTIGIYGHYDVQPEDPVEEWKTPPFELVQKVGKLYGRGVADNKGHIIQNIAAIQLLIESGTLTNNIVFILEGEEETGSESLEAIIQEKKEELQDIDVFYITDSGMFAKNVPQIEYALRGLVYVELGITTGERDLHSGVYGNTAYNPLNILTELLSSMKDLQTGKILIPGFYSDIRRPDAKEMALLSQHPSTEVELLQEMNAFALTTVEGVPAYLASKIEPSMDIHGIQGGFTGEGPKTVIPRTARAKFSFRLVEHQNPEKIAKSIEEYIKKHLPAGVRHELKIFSKDSPFYTSLENEYIQKTAEIMSAHFGNSTVFNRSGGSIPVAEMLQRLLNKPVVLTGFTLPDDNIHAPNENFDEEMFWSGIECLKKIYSM